MIETSIAKKLHLKSGLRAAVINAPSGYVENLGVPLDTAFSNKQEGSVEFVQAVLVFVGTEGYGLW